MNEDMRLVARSEIKVNRGGASCANGGELAEPPAPVSARRKQLM
jgi:hypothetical protein